MGVLLSLQVCLPLRPYWVAMAAPAKTVTEAVFLPFQPPAVVVPVFCSGPSHIPLEEVLSQSDLSSHGKHLNPGRIKTDPLPIDCWNNGPRLLESHTGVRKCWVPEQAIRGSFSQKEISHSSDNLSENLEPGPSVMGSTTPCPALVQLRRHSALDLNVMLMYGLKRWAWEGHWTSVPLSHVVTSDKSCPLLLAVCLVGLLKIVADLDFGAAGSRLWARQLQK